MPLQTSEAETISEYTPRHEKEKVLREDRQCYSRKSTDAKSLHKMNQSGPSSISAPIEFNKKSGYNEIGVKLINQTIARRIYHLIKTVRNQIIKKAYLAKKAAKADQFIRELSKIGDDRLFLTIAYNTPSTIKLLLEYWNKNCPGLPIAVIDNSSNPEQAKTIRNICTSRKINYLKLPENTSNHMCRSHSLAINWSWQNVVCRLKMLKTVGYIDHDCIPIRQWDLSTKPDVFAYGVKNPGYINNQKTWNLWPGFMIFDLSKCPISKNKMDFTVNPLDTLDTGGMNWRLLYRYLGPEEYCFAPAKRIRLDFQSEKQSEPQAIESEVIEDSFLHLNGLTHKTIWQQVDVQEFISQFHSRRQQINK